MCSEHIRTRRNSGQRTVIAVTFHHPYMAACSATKHAFEGYSESVDHKVRDLNVRVPLVESGGTRTSFDDNTTAPDVPLAVYSRQQSLANQVVAERANGGDDPLPP
jgi:short-subunit dehydrogenase